VNGKPRRVGIALPVGACQSVHLPFRARDICDRPPANADDSDISRVAQRDTVSPRRGAGLRGSADADGADASVVSHSESRRSTVLHASRCPEAGAASEFHRFRGSSFRGFGSRRLCGSRGAPSPDCTGDSDAARIPVAVATHPRLGAIKIATSVRPGLAGRPWSRHPWDQGSESRLARTVGSRLSRSWRIREPWPHGCRDLVDVSVDAHQDL